MLSPAVSGLGLQLRTEIPELSWVQGRDPLRARLSIVSPKALALLSPCGISDWLCIQQVLHQSVPHTSEPRAQNSGHLGGAEGVLFFSLFFDQLFIFSHLSEQLSDFIFLIEV